MFALSKTRRKFCYQTIISIDAHIYTESLDSHKASLMLSQKTSFHDILLKKFFVPMLLAYSNIDWVIILTIRVQQEHV